MVQEPCGPKNLMRAFCESPWLEHNVIEHSYGGRAIMSCVLLFLGGGGAMTPWLYLTPITFWTTNYLQMPANTNLDKVPNTWGFKRRIQTTDISFTNSMVSHEGWDLPNTACFFCRLLHMPVTWLCTLDLAARAVGNISTWPRPIKVARRHQSGSRLWMALYCLPDSDAADGDCLTHSAWPWHVPAMSPTHFLWKTASLALRVLAVCIKHHYCIALLHLPRVTPSFPYAGVLSTCWILDENPMDRSSALNPLFCPLLSFHEYKIPAQSGGVSRQRSTPSIFNREGVGVHRREKRVHRRPSSISCSCLLNELLAKKKEIKIL